MGGTEHMEMIGMRDKTPPGVVVVVSCGGLRCGDRAEPPIAEEGVGIASNG